VEVSEKTKLEKLDENFDPDFASPADWAAMYRACGLQIIPSYMPDEVGAGVSWKRPRLAEWLTLQESLIPDATFERWYGAGPAPNMPHARTWAS
jgi:hypothetical protein